MTAYGHKAIIKTWFEIVMLTFPEPDDKDHLFIETSVGFSPTRSLAHKKAHEKKLRHVIVPDRAWQTSHGEWFAGHSKSTDKGYYIREVNLVHDNGRKTLGRRLGEWVYVRKSPNFHKPKR